MPLRRASGLTSPAPRAVRWRRSWSFIFSGRSQVNHVVTILRHRRQPSALRRSVVAPLRERLVGEWGAARRDPSGPPLWDRGCAAVPSLRARPVTTRPRSEEIFLFRVTLGSTQHPPPTTKPSLRRTTDASRKPRLVLPNHYAYH